MLADLAGRREDATRPRPQNPMTIASEDSLDLLEWHSKVYWRRAEGEHQVQPAEEFTVTVMIEIPREESQQI